jgi:hypothetical protein
MLPAPAEYRRRQRWRFGGDHRHAGRFAVSDLDEGAYTVKVLANGFLDLNYGQHYSNGPGRSDRSEAGEILRISRSR